MSGVDVHVPDPVRDFKFFEVEDIRHLCVVYYPQAVWSLVLTTCVVGVFVTHSDGDCSGNLYLGQRIGDEEVLMGRCF